MKKILLSLFAMIVACGAFAATKTDVLNQSVTGVTGTSYTNFSDKEATSKAVYAGQCAGGNSSIQLRSNNNNSGVITTQSGGKVRKVTVTWQESTAAGRVLNIYGSNTAYTAATDLYNDNTAGTLLGTIVNGTSTELEIEGDYEYVGFRSASGAMYLSEVKIEWEVEGSNKKPVVVEFAGKTSYTVFVGESFPFPQAYVKDGEETLYNLAVSYTVDNEDLATIEEGTGETPVVKILAPGQFTIKATFAGNDTYEDASATCSFIAYQKFASIAEILEVEPANQLAALTLNNAVITDIYVTGSGSRNGIYIQDESSEETIEIFCYNVPESWEVGGLVSGTVYGNWKDYKGTKEICPNNWDGLEYTPVFFIHFERVVNQGYAPDVVEYDDDAVLEALGVESYEGVQYYAINQSDGEWVQYNGIATALGNTDGWLNSEGDVTMWGNGSYVCLKYPEDGEMALCTMPGNEPALDSEFSAQWALVAGDKTVILDVTIVFVEAPEVELALSETVYATKAVVYTTEDGNYLEKTATLSDESIAAICEELGIQSISDATIYAYNPTTKEVITVYAAFDGWRDANGDFHEWSGTLDVPFCVKDGDGATYYCYNIKHSEAASYKAYWILANETTMKGVLVEIPVEFTLSTGISSVKTANAKSAIFNAAGQQLSAPQKGLNIIDGKKVYVK